MRSVSYSGDDFASPPVQMASTLQEDPGFVGMACRIRSRVPIPLAGSQMECEFITFHGISDGLEHFCVGFGPWESQECPLVRVHSECITGDMFGSLRCDCGPQLSEARHLMAQEGGLIVYLRQEGRGIGLYNKLEAYELQIQGFDTFAANTALGFKEDERSYLAAAEMLRCLGVRQAHILTNNPDKVTQLRRHGLQIQGVRQTGHFHNRHNAEYLAAKQRRSPIIDPQF